MGTKLVCTKYISSVNLLPGTVVTILEFFKNYTAKVHISPNANLNKIKLTKTKLNYYTVFVLA